VEKYCTAGPSAAGNMVHAHCMLTNKSYKHTIIICDTFCFPQHQWSRWSASILRSMYVTCLVSYTSR